MAIAVLLAMMRRIGTLHAVYCSDKDAVGHQMALWNTDGLSVTSGAARRWQQPRRNQCMCLPARLDGASPLTPPAEAQKGAHWLHPNGFPSYKAR